MPFFFRGARQRGRNLLVLDGQDARHEFDHRDLDAERVPEVGELDADGAGADDDDGLRHLRQHHRFAVGDHAVTVRLDAGQELGARAGRDDRARRLQVQLARFGG